LNSFSVKSADHSPKIAVGSEGAFSGTPVQALPRAGVTQRGAGSVIEPVPPDAVEYSLMIAMVFFLAMDLTISARRLSRRTGGRRSHLWLWYGALAAIGFAAVDYICWQIGVRGGVLWMRPDPADRILPVFIHIVIPGAAWLVASTLFNRWVRGKSNNELRGSQESGEP
jgi:hypothetical protein